MPSARVARVLRHVAANVRRLRTRAGLTQEELAELSDLDLTHLQKIERGKVNFSVAVLIGIYDALDVQPGALFRPATLAPVQRGRPRSKAKTTARRPRTAR